MSIDVAAVTQSPSQPILILDSGVGGLSVYSHIRRRLPQLPCVYLADAAGYPYGTKSESEILQRVVHLIEQANRQFAPQLIVIACNTASTLVLPELRRRVQVPVVGVVPAIKTAAALSHSRSIGLLATPGTIAREYTEQLIGSFAPDCQIIRVGSHELVHLAEQRIRGEMPQPQQLREILRPFFNPASQLDAIVLGCTHFPLLTEQLAAATPWPVRWVDSGDAIARRVSQLLASQEQFAQDSRMLSPNTATASQLALMTQAYDPAMIRGVLEFGFERIELFPH